MQFTSPIDREICQAAFGKVQRGIAYFRQQVQAAIESRLHDAVVHEVLALADAMEQEVIAAVTGAGIQADGVSYNRAYCSQVMPAAALCGGESPERGSYESMRQALQDTQRRCANLLANIYKESEVNRALSKAKAKAEACSKKLTEQVSQQTEEINRLAQTISAQEQLEEAHKKTRIEVNLREKDFQRKLAAARKDADDRCNALQESLVNKLHSTRRAAEKAGLESKVDANIQSDAPLLVSNLQTALGSTRHGTPEQLEMAEECKCLTIVSGGRNPIRDYVASILEAAESRRNVLLRARLKAIQKAISVAEVAARCSEGRGFSCNSKVNLLGMREEGPARRDGIQIEIRLAFSKDLWQRTEKLDLEATGRAEAEKRV